jgi:hypothetical protein
MGSKFEISIGPESGLWDILSRAIYINVSVGFQKGNP